MLNRTTNMLASIRALKWPVVYILTDQKTDGLVGLGSKEVIPFFQVVKDIAVVGQRDKYTLASNVGCLFCAWNCKAVNTAAYNAVCE